jgi:hypothetical protein
MMDELAQLYNHVEEGPQRAEREADTLKLEPYRRYMAEMELSELQYWCSVFGEVNIDIEPDSDKPF